MIKCSIIKKDNTLEPSLILDKNLSLSKTEIAYILYLLENKTYFNLLKSKLSKILSDDDYRKIQVTYNQLKRMSSSISLVDKNKNILNDAITPIIDPSLEQNDV
jgi:uncharacterized phage-like protein YoqJ